MDIIDQIIGDVLRREGGFSDNPDDRGGPTNHGISLRLMRLLHLDEDRDGDVDVDDVRLVDIPESTRILRTEFYEKPRLDRLPESVQPIVFDIAVNSGPGQAVQILQGALNRLGAYPALREDGVLGPATVMAAERALDVLGPQRLQGEIADEREEFFEAIVRRRPSQASMLQGWLNRSHEFH